MALMLIVPFAFALWLNSLEAPSTDIIQYERPWVITANPFDRKIRVKREGKPENKIGISGTVEAQSRAGEDTSLNVSHEGIHLKALAPPVYDDSFLLARLADLENVTMKLIDSRGIVDSTLQVNPLAILIQRRL